MNIFDLSFVNVTQIINAEKLLYKTGARSVSKEWRNNYDGNEYGYYSLSFTLDGEAEYHFAKKTLTPKKNCIMYLDNYTPFNYKITNNHHFYTINFVANGGLIQEPNMYIPDDPEKYSSMFKEACTYYKHKTPGYLLMTTSILLKILASIKEEHSRLATSKNKFDKIVHAIDYIKANISNPSLSVESISAQLGISGTHLRNMFLKECGMTPIKYIKTFRINEACKVLVTNPYSVNEVAQMCGFYNTSYFCKEFKKVMGTTPYTYKKNI